MNIILSTHRNSVTDCNCQITNFTIHNKSLNLGVQSFIGFSGIQVSNDLTIGGILFFHKPSALPRIADKVVKIFASKKRIIGIYVHYPNYLYSEICGNFKGPELPSFTIKLNLKSPKPEKLQQFQLISKTTPHPLVEPKSYVAACM